MKQRLRAELSAARAGFTAASEALRHAGNFPERLKNELRRGWPSLLGKHPWPWTIGMAVCGFLAARQITKPRARHATILAPKKSGPGWISQLMISSAGFVLKPVVKDYLISRINARMHGPPNRTAR